MEKTEIQKKYKEKKNKKKNYISSWLSKAEPQCVRFVVKGLTRAPRKNRSSLPLNPQGIAQEVVGD